MSAARALAAGVRAPVSRWRLVLVLWLARLVPAALVIGLPVYEAAIAQLGRHPDGAALLDASTDASGFSHAWSSDLTRTDLAGVPDSFVWLVVLAWLLTTVLSGGITARLLYGRGQSGLFLAECGRYAGRFVRLGLLALFVAYALDALVNAVLAAMHTETGRAQFVQDYAIERAWARAALYLTVLQLLGMIHAYARIDVVLHERRSAALSWLRGCGILVTRLPALLLVEAGMLAATGAVALVAWLLLRGANPVAPGSSWGAIALFFALAAVASYLRTGIELGTMDARCRLLGSSQNGTPEPPAEAEPEFVPV